MQRPNRRPHASLQHFRDVGYTEDVYTKAQRNEYPPVEQLRIPGISEYDERRWPSSEFGLGFYFKDKCPKGQIFDRFCGDIVDLCFLAKQTNLPGQKTAHLYLCWELERRAWEKYGGPNGLRAAHINRRQGRRLNYPCHAEYEETEIFYDDGAEYRKKEEEKEKKNEELVQRQIITMQHWLRDFTPKQRDAFFKAVEFETEQRVTPSSTPKKPLVLSGTPKT
ncbi:hypothetical protein CPC08DRAFT_769634 [Agrocybe pediades]|nr:hypothetical protein CPC08DRAFT_769634 [Agrocybe pediades]